MELKTKSETLFVVVSCCVLVWFVLTCALISSQ